MKIIKTIKEIKDFTKECKNNNRTIGFVPTMGYLHKGHISLVEKSIIQNDVTILSIYVNPTQFAPGEDLEKYPRDIDGDIKLADEAGVDIIFAPDSLEMYPEGYKTFINVEAITGKLCGKSRPMHFKGVTTIVAKLINIVEADNAYFGQKDAQQVAVIKSMVIDLNMNVKIVVCPIVRENDGLALSSRNVYLSTEERKAALVLSKSLSEAAVAFSNGEINKKKILDFIRDEIKNEPMASIDYVEAVNADTLDDIDYIEKNTLIALAVRFGKTRLIDNIILN